MIDLRGITKIFNQGKPNQFTSIGGITLKIPEKTVTCFKGPSGSGKTTLLSMIGCLARPTSGRITLNGQILSGLPERFRAGVRQRSFGFIFQNFELIRGLTVMENIMLPGYPLGRPYKQLRSRASALLDRFGLSTKKSVKIETLSGGEAQRTGICRALINEPDILIADEPTANLDTALSLDLMAIFRDLNQSGKTILIASHDPIIIESPVIDIRVTMCGGRIEETGV